MSEDGKKAKEQSVAADLRSVQLVRQSLEMSFPGLHLCANNVIPSSSVTSFPVQQNRIERLSCVAEGYVVPAKARLKAHFLGLESEEQRTETRRRRSLSSVVVFAASSDAENVDATQFQTRKLTIRRGKQVRSNPKRSAVSGEHALRWA